MFDPDRIRASFARQAMMTTFGAELLSVREGAVTIAAPILPGSTQQQGLAHGALAFGLGDSAAGYSALTLVPAEFEVVTSEMGIHYLAAGRGERLVAEGLVIRPGRRSLVTSADVYAEADGQRTHIARLTGTMVRVPA
ncbi:PaaI family thioesterase [Pseudoponticoccus marisrubri]|uniref:Phenylacetic acid degradation protein n=1 Tax=Pseudoponticoccus marisrubri TaxID=1685382 RepID=A0A0W7WH33_9RHOB|nr:PaaI family thioesterase [Pseudoponticoccus marisrubri]KUF09812.1 phenylacetic acid degradation protein [Pseudoponticoccus marisrubri]